MRDTLLITFGCSWTYGVGVNYEPGMSQEQLRQKAWDSDLCKKLSWRGLLSDRFDLYNLNHAAGGSSNQRQFRKAMEFFGSQKYLALRHKFNKIVVLWGITSTARTELWSVDRNQHHNFFLSDDDDFARFITKHCYDHDQEVFQLRNLMLFWNVFFKDQQIQNYWFDTFNTHNYDHDFKPHGQNKTFDTDINFEDMGKQKAYQDIAGPDWPSYKDFCLGNLVGVSPKIIEEIKTIFNNTGIGEKTALPTTVKPTTTAAPLYPVTNLLDYDHWPRDLMSQLMHQAGITVPKEQQTYHQSYWNVDRAGMQQLVDLGFLNPYSHHPTKKGHEVLCEYFARKLQEELGQHA